jgi:hypothetical protein
VPYAMMMLLDVLRAFPGQVRPRSCLGPQPVQAGNRCLIAIFRCSLQRCLQHSSTSAVEYAHQAGSKAAVCELDTALCFCRCRMCLA